MCTYWEWKLNFLFKHLSLVIRMCDGSRLLYNFHEFTSSDFLFIVDEFFWALKIEFIEKILIKLKPTRISIFILSHNYENFNINKKIVTGIHQPTSSSLSLHLLLRTHEMEMQSLQIYGNYIAIEIKSIPSNFTSSGGLSILLQLYAHTKPIFLAIVRHWMVH